MILPTFMASEIEEAQASSTAVKIPKEYGVDFTTGRLTGQIVTGLEAIKVWIWNTLLTERYLYGIYGWDYGVEYTQYIGQTLDEEYLNSDCQIETEEALMVNEWITNISDFSASVTDGVLNVKFTVETSLGNMEVDIYV